LTFAPPRKKQSIRKKCRKYMHRWLHVTEESAPEEESPVSETELDAALKEVIIKLL
jgi:hypothetical protein